MKTKNYTILKFFLLALTLLLSLSSCDLLAGESALIGRKFGFETEYLTRYTVSRVVSFHGKNEGVYYEECYDNLTGTIYKPSTARTVYFTYRYKNGEGELIFNNNFSGLYTRVPATNSIFFTLSGGDLTLLDIFTDSTAYKTDPVVDGATTVNLKEETIVDSFLKLFDDIIDVFV